MMGAALGEFAFFKLMTRILDPELGAAFLTLTALEIVLGIDNIIFLSISANRLPSAQRNSARLLGLAGAMGTRILLLISLSLMARLTTPWVTVLGHGFSGRDLILLAGGLFLLAKSTLEIHHQFEADDPEEAGLSGRSTSRFVGVVVQIAILDIVFSLDSVITAVGMTQNLPVMIAAIVTAVVVMMFFSGAVSRFVERHPTIRTLALSFLTLIGTALVAEGIGFEIPKGYIYFAMAFSSGVEMINLRMHKKNRRAP